MSTALWYYCNNQAEASTAIPVVQRLQNAVQDDLKTSVVRPEPKLVVGVEEDDELAVGRTTYVLAAAFNATPNTTSVVAKKVEVKKDLVAASEPVKIAAKPEEEVTQIPSEEEATDVVEEKEPMVVHEESEIKETVVVVETVKDAVEIVAVVEEDILDSVVAQAATEEEEAEQPVSEPVVLEETVTKETTKDEALLEAATVQSDSLVVDKAEDVIVDVDPEPRKLVTRMPSIPEDTASVHDEIPKNEDVVEEEQEAAVHVKPIVDYESETETQSEISEAPAIEAVEPVAIAKSEDEPESEIEETMVIDPVAAAKEAAAVEKQTSAFSFIPEQIRNNSYAVSSVAVAVTTAIVATLVARR